MCTGICARQRGFPFELTGQRAGKPENLGTLGERGSGGFPRNIVIDCITICFYYSFCVSAISLSLLDSLCPLLRIVRVRQRRLVWGVRVLLVRTTFARVGVGEGK